MTNNKSIKKWLDEQIELVKPEKVVWIDGGEEQLEALRKEACATGEMIKLNEEKLPGCYLHRTAVNDVARVEGRTLICTPTKEEAGPTNNWMEPGEAYKMLADIARDSYKGRTMYVPCSCPLRYHRASYMPLRAPSSYWWGLPPPWWGRR